MQLINKNILLISPEPWNHIFVSKHHYATHLAKRNNNVYFLNPPSRGCYCIPTEFENVYSVQYHGFIRALRFFPRFLQKQLIKKKFEELERLCNTKFEIVWSFDNSVFFDFSALPNSILCISHIVDLNQDFELEKAAQTADICLTSTHILKEKLQPFNRNTFFINHGVNLLTIHDKIKMPGINEIKCFYAGNLNSKYLDKHTLTRIIVENPSVDFVFAGSLSNCNYIHFDNSHYMGNLDANELQKFYNSTSLLIICYLADNYEDQLANPHKMMEYLATGKAIVASKTMEYNLLKEEGLIAMSERNDLLPSIFKSVIENLDSWNSKEKQKKRSEFAISHAYTVQIEKIEEIISPFKNN